MISFPNAKINIGLYVVSKRGDGYHNLETIFYPVQLADALEFVEADKTELTVSGIEIPGRQDDNLILKAYKLLSAEFKLPPLHFYLHKAIPMGAGLGGGSSDASFALGMLNNYFSLGLNNETLVHYSSLLGSDCPFFIINRPCYASGTGNILTEISLDLSDYKVLIVKPPVHVNTSAAFQNIAPKPSGLNLEEIGLIPVEQWEGYIMNDFEPAIFSRYPEISDIKTTLYNIGALFASMSGSGSAVYGLFKELPVHPESFFPDTYFVYR